MVYAGAIMVLFLFVLMLLNVKAEERAEGEGRALKLVAIGPGRGCWSRRWASVLVRARRAPLAAGLRRLHARRWPSMLFSPQYLYVFEATSILILAALVGAVVAGQEGPVSREPRPRPATRCS